MADIEQVLNGERGDVARLAADAAQVPDFESLARRGRGRRTRRQAGALAAAALAVAGIVGAVQVFGNGDGDVRPGPADTPSPTAPASEASDGPSQAELAAVVDAADASILSMAVTPGDPERMAVLWQWEDQRWVLAWTTDGFATRSLRAVPSGSSLTAAADGAFVLREGWEGAVLRLLDDEGVSDPVAVADKVEPVGAGEVPVVLAPEEGGTPVIAVAADGTGHPIPVRAGLDSLQSFGNRLAGFTYGDGLTYYWSDDGGATWQDADPGPGEFPPLVVQSAIGQDHAIFEGGDGATLFPFVAIRTASAAAPDQWTRTEAEKGVDYFTLGGAWNEDGEIRVLASRWNDKDRLVDAGVWRVVGGSLEKVAGTHPEVTDSPDVAPLGFEYVDGPVVWVPGTNPGEVWRTTDGGATWEQFAAR
ncbi:hypothetical protein [Nocardioides sp. WS12]|uniref:hypothetical protein n=1 Tax=Nocardioides sp. WS12 TaxID=2486272 RepID=UPI0015F9A8E7|nr:hypothetical protein [Nocardioides sp. WS12]